MNIIKPITKRIRAFKAKKFIEDKQDKKLLDIGCNDRFFINSFKKLKVDGIDIKYGQDAEQGLDYKDNSFDYVTMLAVIEHFNNHNKVISECYRVLKNNGLMIITTPFKKAEIFIKIYHKLDHKRYFIKKDFENLKGFELIHYSIFEFRLNQLVVLKKIKNNCN